MGLPRIVGVVAIVGGVVVAVVAVNATGALGRELTQSVAGCPLDVAMWYILGGLGMTTAGGYVLHEQWPTRW